MSVQPGHAQSLSDAFNQGAAMGRSGNAAARTQINATTAQGTVPGYTTSAPQASYFGGAGLGSQAGAATSACAAAATSRMPASVASPRRSAPA